MARGLLRRLAGAAAETARDLGLRVQTLTPELARPSGMEEEDEGVIVTRVEQASIAARAGLSPGDLIVSVGEIPVDNLEDFREAMEEHDLEQGIRMQVKREGMHRFVFIRSE